MNVTGYQLREAIKQWTLRKTAHEQSFADSFHKFEKEEKDPPAQVIANLTKAEIAIVVLQEAQMRYNLAVRIDSIPELSGMTLAMAIKLLGTADRAEKLWRSVAIQKKNRYDPGPVLVRDPTQERAIPTTTAKEILDHTTLATKKTGTLRAVIATANSQVVPIEDLNEALFE